MIAYIITNTINGKRYVGITKRSVAKRWWEHKRAAANAPQLIGKAIAKYGHSAFIVEAVASAKSIDDLLELECLLIAQYGTLEPDGYNLTSGGFGLFQPSDGLRERIGFNLLGIPRSAEVKAKIAATHIGMLPTKESKDKNSASHIGKRLSPETRTKMSIAGFARAERERIAGKAPRSAEHCAKLAAARTGKTTSEETKAKMSAARKGKKKPPGAYINAGIARRVFPDRVLTKTEITARYKARLCEAKSTG